MNTNRTLGIVLILFLFSIMVVPARASTGTTYSIDAETLDYGGGLKESNTYRLQDSLGQLSGAILDGTQYRLYSGFVGQIEEAEAGFAIIISGRKADNDPLNKQINNACNNVYRVLLNRGYAKSRIYYLSNDTSQDADGDGLADVSAESTKKNMENAISQWAKSQKVGPNLPLFIYIMDHGGRDAFRRLSPTETLTPKELASWLNQLINETNCKVLIVYEACQSGSFLDDFKNPNMVLIASTGDKLPAYASPEGAYFSDYFFASVAAGDDLRRSFEKASISLDATQRLTAKQTPVVDANGDGSYTTEDLKVLENKYIGTGFKKAAPAIVSKSPNRTLNPDENSHTFWVTVSNAELVEKVGAIVVPPDFTVQMPTDPDTLMYPLGPAYEVNLTPKSARGGSRGEVTYEGSYSNFATGGDWDILLYVRPKEGIADQSFDMKVTKLVKAQHDFAKGVTMFSVPLAPKEPCPEVVLDIDKSLLKGNLAVWDPITKSYLFYDPNNPLDPYFQVSPGKSWWLKLDAAKAVNPEGTPVRVTEPFDKVELEKGWNMFGNPFGGEVQWSHSSIKVQKIATGEEKTLADAAGAGWINKFAWGWDQTKGEYVLIYDPSFETQIPGVLTKLEPWKGYWIKAQESCKLILPPPGKSVESVKLKVKSRKEQATKDNWQVQLVAVVGGIRDSVNVFGVSSAEVQGVKMESPPRALSQGYVDLYFVGADTSSLAIDLRPPLSAKAVWRFIVETDIPNTVVAIAWPNLSGVPKDYKLILVDEETGKRKYMRTTSAYTFRSGETGAMRKFRIEVEASGWQPLRIYDIVTMPNRADGTVSVSYRLSAEATVDVKILSLAGRLVRTVSLGQVNRAGINSLVWNLRDDSGVLVPNGVYLCQISAVTEEGQAAKGTRAIIVKK